MPSLLPVIRSAAVMVTLSAVLCAVAIGLEHKATEARRRAQESAAAAREHVAAARAAEIALDAYGDRYEALSRRGIIGDSQRLAFAEAVESAARELRLRAVSYELRPTTVSANLSTSPMKLRFGVVHEGELLRFLDRLRERAPAVVWARRCTMEPAPGAAAPVRDKDNLLAECELEWMTVRAK